MHSSYKEAQGLWKAKGGFWDLFGSTPEMNLVWQAMLEKITELASKESDVVNYSIEDMPVKKMVRWEEVDIDTNSLDANIMSIPTMQDGINSVDDIYVEETDYTLVWSSTEVTISWIIAQPTDTNLWAPIVYYYNDRVEKYYNDGFLDLVLAKYNPNQRKHILRLVWNAIIYGPTKANIIAVINALAGVPFMRYTGEISLGGSNIDIDYKLIVRGQQIDDGSIIYNEIVKGLAVDVADNIAHSEAYYGPLTEGIIEVDEELVSLGGIEDVTDDPVLAAGDVLVDYTKEVIFYLIEGTGTTYCFYIYPMIDDYSYTCDVFKRSKIYPELLFSGSLKNSDTGDVYNIINGNIPDLNMDDNEYTLAHHYLNRLSDNNEKIDSQSKMVGAAVNSFKGTDIATGSWLPAFIPIYKVFDIHEWTDVVYDEAVLDIVKNDLINYVYNQEINQIYHLKTGVTDSNEIEIEASDLYFDHLSDGDVIDIVELKKNTIAISSIYQDDDDNWVIELTDTYDYAVGDNILVYQPDVVTNQRNIGELCTIIGGKYENGIFILTVNQDLTDVEAGYVVSGASAERITKIHNLRTVESIALRVLTLDGDITALKNSFVIIKKTKSGAHFGDINIKSVTGIVGKVITLSASYTEEDDHHYLILKDDINPAILCEIDSITGDEVTVVDTVVGDYDTTKNLKAIFVKTLPYHNGFRIIENPLNAYSTATILSDYPDFEDNVDKVLSKLLPAGSQYDWRI